jgi:hypothetical protein
LHSSPSTVRKPVITGDGKGNPKGKGKGKGLGKPTLTEGDKDGKGKKGEKGKNGGKGRKGGKGDKGKLPSILKTTKTGVRWSGKGQPPGSSDAAQHCSRCNVSHWGGLADKCMRPPCRFCTAENFSPTDHTVFKCPRKPPKGKRDSEPPAKRTKFNVMEQINSMTAEQYNEMDQTFTLVREVRGLITNGEAQAEEDTEQVLAVSAVKAPRIQQQLVPYVPTNSALTLTAVHTKLSEGAKLKEAVRRVGLARLAEGRDGRQRSLTEVEPAKESTKTKISQFGNVAQGAWNGMPEGETLQMLLEFDEPEDELLFRRPAFGGALEQPETTCCSRLSGGLVSFFEENSFSNFHLLPLLRRTDGVCGSNGSPDDASAVRHVGGVDFRG